MTIYTATAFKQPAATAAITLMVLHLLWNLAVNTAQAEENIAGTYSKPASATTSAGKAVGASTTIRIGPTVKNRASLSVEIAEPTTRQVCGGSIYGRASVNGHRLTLHKRQFNEVCTLVVEVIDGKASVISEHGCGGYHGVGCSFDTSAIGLLLRLPVSPHGNPP